MEKEHTVTGILDRSSAFDVKCSVRLGYSMRRSGTFTIARSTR